MFQQIQKLKDIVSELREYLLSDCCQHCEYILKQIQDYEQQIEELEKDIVQ
jgi:hypothetical protein